MPSHSKQKDEGQGVVFVMNGTNWVA